ncbi:MAG: hypothetical protein AMJ46_12530 [Latescibacteria bacterium DG_63]|nr:MAG: hypothetical protein AMJ46_12530 [Latescibacteria bacterium DG_63]
MVMTVFDWREFTLSLLPVIEDLAMTDEVCRSCGAPVYLGETFRTMTHRDECEAYAALVTTKRMARAEVVNARTRA